MIVHMVFFGFVFKNSSEKMKDYPPVMMVRLASPPPARGVEKPAVAKTKTKSKIIKKTETPKTETRVTELNKRKKPARKKTETKPARQTDTETPKTQTQEKQGLPEGVELGSEFGSARLDASGFDSPYYLNIVFSKIRRSWDNPFEGGDTVSCVIYFVIDRRGKISDSAIENSSGLSAYDQAALRAVLGSKPPPLPNQFGSEELGIHLEFRYIPYN
jgi:TonB family protein